jgi:hypothetical protein
MDAPLRHSLYHSSIEVPHFKKSPKKKNKHPVVYGEDCQPPKEAIRRASEELTLPENRKGAPAPEAGL